MPNSLVCEDPSVKVIVGVDTHKHEHVAVAINGLGARLAMGRAAANQAGYAELLAWARQLGEIEAFGIEGTGSYGVGLAQASSDDMGSASSRSTTATGASGATTARTTRSMPRLQPGRYWPESRPPRRRPPTARQKWSARSRSPAIRL